MGESKRNGGQCQNARLESAWRTANYGYVHQAHITTISQIGKLAIKLIRSPAYDKGLHYKHKKQRIHEHASDMHVVYADICALIGR